MKDECPLCGKEVQAHEMDRGPLGMVIEIDAGPDHDPKCRWFHPTHKKIEVIHG
jgi:hypothetical protein